MQISQIYLSDGDNELPPYIKGCIEAAQDLFPHFQHVLYNLGLAREFLVKNFGNEVLNAFDGLNPYAYKADLLRYCLLHAEGGWYFDIAVRPLLPIEVPSDIETIAFKDMPIISQTTWSCANTVLYAQPKSPVYENAVKLVLENCKNNYYGINSLCPTGPVLLGKAFALQGESSRRVFGDFIQLTPLHNNKNPAFVLPDGLIFAFGKPMGGGDLSGVGTKGTNNYNDFYQSRTVYK